eukprot:m.36276 g.36276  ORF g.36276 m.36276 type:complete len:277 (+) comp17322_c0_seq3:266-1096(+)
MDFFTETSCIVGAVDLDRNMRLSLSHLFRWMQTCRMTLPWIGPNYENFNKELPTMRRRLVVKTQMIRLKPATSMSVVEKKIEVKMDVGSVGNTSLEFRYTIFVNGENAGTGLVVSVCVGGEEGNLKPSILPDRIKALSATTVSQDRKFLRDSIDLIKEPTADVNSFSYSFTVRFSDEDVNKHVNHSKYALFVEDARQALVLSGHPLAGVAEQHLDTIIIEYAAEARVGDRCKVWLTCTDGHALDFHIYRLHASDPNKNQLLTRGRSSSTLGNMNKL